MSKKQPSEIVVVDRIEPCILLIRGQRVLLDSDLATLYGTSTKRLNEQVKRNLDRFPADFVFRLTAEEAEMMRSQIVTANLRSQTVTSSDPPTATGSQATTGDLRSQFATSSLRPLPA